MYVRIRPKIRKKKKISDEWRQDDVHRTKYNNIRTPYSHQATPPTRRHGRRATREQKDLQVHVADRQNTGDGETADLHMQLQSYQVSLRGYFVLSGYLDYGKNTFIYLPFHLGSHFPIYYPYPYLEHLFRRPNFIFMRSPAVSTSTHLQSLEIGQDS